MSSFQPTTPSKKPTPTLTTRIFHWINIIAVFLMFTSGLQIYNANPVFGGRAGLHIFPLFTLGGWLAGGRHWHFAAMWLLAINLIAYGLYILITQRWKHHFVGKNDIKALQKSQNPKRRNYAWHRIVYTSIIPILLLSIFTGIGMYKPAQFHWIVDFFGSWQALRIVHFATIPILIIYIIIHPLLARKSGGEVLVESMFWPMGNGE